MTTAITLSGESLIALKQANVETLNIDKMIFANVAGITENTPVDRSQIKPTAGEIQAELDINTANRVNDNVVVYSLTLESHVGTFSYNWIGLYSSEDDTLIAVAYVPEQEKRATVGDEIGNVLTKNFALEFNGAESVTGVTINAESWQLDYTNRLNSMDDLQRNVSSVLTDQAMFKDTGFKIKYESSNFYLSQGESVVDGLYLSNNTDLLLTVPALPKTAWLEVWQERNMAGVLNRFDVVYNDGSAMAEIIENGELHRFIKLAVINSTANIVDERINVTDSFALYHKGNMPSASTSQKGIVQLLDSIESTSDTHAATANAAKVAYDKGQSALDLAGTKAASSHNHGAGDLPNASTSAKGVVQLLDSIENTSVTHAATANAVKEAFDKGQSALDLAGTKAASSHNHGAGDLPNASTSAKGVVQLLDSIENTSVTHAATANAVKEAYDKGQSALDKAVLKDAFGNVGIGTTEPQSIGSSVTTLEIKGGSNNQRTGGVRLTSINNELKAAFYGESNLVRLGTETSNPLTFVINNIERSRFDESGNLLVGKTVTDFDVSGSVLRSDGYVLLSRENGDALAVNRIGDNGVVQTFYKDGGLRGSVEVTTDSININSVSGASSIDGSGKVFGVNNILGTVSESDGTPTGAIFERGSNVNGDYVKYADGTLICTAREARTSGDDGDWDFPVSSVTRPKVFGQCSQFGADPVVLKFSLSTALPSTHVSWAPFRAFNDNTVIADTYVDMLMIGTWF